MTGAQASRVVLVSGGIMVTFTLIESARRHRASDETYRSLWAIGLLTLGLSILADIEPRAAGPLAAVVIVGAVARNTGALGSVIGGAGKKKPVQKSTAAPTVPRAAAVRRTG